MGFIEYFYGDAERFVALWYLRLVWYYIADFLMPGIVVFNKIHKDLQLIKIYAQVPLQ